MSSYIVRIRIYYLLKKCFIRLNTIFNLSKTFKNSKGNWDPLLLYYIIWFFFSNVDTTTSVSLTTYFSNLINFLYIYIYIYYEQCT